MNNGKVYLERMGYFIFYIRVDPLFNMISGVTMFTIPIVFNELFQGRKIKQLSMQLK
mgnify:CR=1 FL=1